METQPKMQLFSKLAFAAFATGLMAAPALAADPTGTWQTATGESRYKVSYCGDGTQLCAMLTWLREDARTNENLAYLNDYVVTGAVPAGENEWTGRVRYDGDTFVGSVTLMSDNSLKLRGCKGMFCQTMDFVRL